MSRAGPCPGCGTAIAADQRYCISCGKRLVAFGLPRPVAAARDALARPAPVPARWPARLPSPSWAGALASAALGFGLLVGIAIGPGAGGVGLATSLIQLPGGDGGAAEAVPGPGSLGATDGGPPALGGPVGNTAFGSSAPVPAPAPAASAEPFSDPAPSAPFDQAPTRTPPDPEPPPPSDPQPDPPPKPEAPPVLKGTVVHTNAGARSYVLADGSAQLSAVHTREDLPEPGQEIEIRVRELENGTYAEDGNRSRSGRRATARLAGTVTFSDQATGSYVISRRGASVLIQPPPPGSPPPGGDPGAEQQPPRLGAPVTVTAAIEPLPEPAPVVPDPQTPAPSTTQPPGCEPAAPSSQDPAALLRQRELEVEGDPLGYSDIEGIVQTTCEGPDRLVLSADDHRASAADIVFTVPEEIDLETLEPGDIVNATGIFGPEVEGYELTGISSDEGIRGANDPELGQGDQSARRPAPPGFRAWLKAFERL